MAEDPVRISSSRDVTAQPRQLPRRAGMIELYYWPTPNGHKITMFPEEVGLPYEIRPVDISAGDQFKP
jgi:hypothetical protein